MKYYILLALFIVFLANSPSSFAKGDNLLEFDTNNVPVSDIKPNAAQEGIFSLTTIMENFLNYETNAKNQDSTLSQTQKQRLAFVSATQKFNQGNVAVAYDEFENLLDAINSDYALLVYAKSMYEIGFFSIGSKSLDKIKHKDFLKEQTQNLKISYLPSIMPDKNEEIYLAKAYSSIYFDNSAQESAYELNKKTSLTDKSDYANYILAQALNKSRQYQQALIFINKAQTINPKNISYINFKIKVLIGLQKYKEALKVIEDFETAQSRNYVFKNSFMVQKEEALAGLAKKDDDKKYHLAMKTFLEGNYQKTIRDCKNILSFDKNNYKILTLLAMAQFICSDKEEAKKNYLQSYQINKNYPFTLNGLGDVEFCESNFEEAAKYYKKALGQNSADQTAALKLALIYKNDPKLTKELKNIEKKLAKMDAEPYLSYYAISATVARENQRLRQEYIRKAATINPLYENGWAAFLRFELDNKRYDMANSFLYMVSFSNRTNYIYFYLNALYDIALGDTNQAIVNLKNCLSLNPDFEDANKKLLEILPTKVEDMIPKAIPEEFIDQPVL